MFFENNILVLCGCIVILIIIAVISCTVKFLWLKKSLDEKTVQLIQYCLDTKFLYNNLTDSLEETSSAAFCTKFIKKIKEYYNLEDVVIIDNVKMISEEKNTALRKDIIEYVQVNFEKMKPILHGHRLVKFTFSTSQKKYEMYITRLTSKEEGEGLVICIEYAPTLLSKQEKASLESNINLLKNRLLN